MLSLNFSYHMTELNHSSIALEDFMSSGPGDNCSLLFAVTGNWNQTGRMDKESGLHIYNGVYGVC